MRFFAFRICKKMKKDSIKTVLWAFKDFVNFLFILKNLWDKTFFISSSFLDFLSWLRKGNCQVSSHPFLQHRRARKLPIFCVISTEKRNYLFTTFLVNEEKVQTGTVKWSCCLRTDLFPQIGILCSVLHVVYRVLHGNFLIEK